MAEQCQAQAQAKLCLLASKAMLASNQLGYYQFVKLFSLDSWVGLVGGVVRWLV